MKMYEIAAVMKYQYLKDKESWEQTRLISYIIAQTNSTKKIKLTDIIEFPWEKENTKANQTISNEDKERLEKLAKEYEKKYFNSTEETE